MPAGETSDDADLRWRRLAHVRVRAADAVECGWSHEVAEALFRERFPDRDAVPAAELRALVEPGGDGASPRATGEPEAADRGHLFAALAADVIDYRIERERVAGEYEPIRQTRVKLKLLKSPDVSADVLRSLASELGWRLRDDEEGTTVPVADLLPYFRRPVVRQLLDAKMAQCGVVKPGG